MTEDEQDLFLQAMHDVQAADEGGKVSRRKRPPRAQVRLRQPTQAAATHGKTSTLRVGDSPWILQADGVSATTLRRLAQGQPAIDATLDLHGCNQQQAHEALQRHLRQLYQQGGRVLRIIHGRGLHSDGRPVLKTAVYHLLQHSALAAHVLAVVPEHGSAGGACLLLLRRKRT